MDSAVKQFLIYLRSVRNASPHTIRSYDNDLGQFLTFLTPPGTAMPAPAGRHAPHDPRIRGAPARPETGKILDRPKARGDSIVLQICGAGRRGRAEPGAHGGDSQAAEAHPLGVERRGSECVSRWSGGGTGARVRARQAGIRERRQPADGQARPRDSRNAVRVRAARQRTHRTEPWRHGPEGTHAARARQGQQGTHRPVRRQSRTGARSL